MSSNKEKSQFLKMFVDHNLGKSNDMLSSVVQIAKYSLMVCLFLILTAAYFGARAISLSGEQKIVNYVVERDSKTGAVLDIRKMDASKLADEKDLWVMGDLEKFISLVRSSSVDLGTIKRNRIEAEKMILNGSEAAKQIGEWMSKNDVYKRMLDNGEYVIPKSFVKRRTGKDNYVLSWVETVKNVNSNKLIRTDHYRAEVRVEFRKTNSQEVFEGNPLGLYINSITTDLVNSITE